jgi:hypothetical protein
MFRGKSFPSIAAAIACLLGSTGVAWAQQAAADIGELAGAAKVVVHSRVAKVEYRLSPPGTNGQPAVPYTVVTYDVVRVARGTLASPSFTLRYIGGPDGRGSFLEASHVPVFQVGDEDILFVEDSGEEGCPLVDCIEGRFRILDGAVYNGRGSPVLAVSGDRVVARGVAPMEFRRVRYPAPKFDDLLKNPEVAAILRQQGLSVEEARRQYNAQAPSTIEVVTEVRGGTARDAAGGGAAGRAFQQQGTARPIELDRFLAAVSAAATFAAGQRGGSLRSVDADAPIPAPVTAAAAPQAPVAGRQVGPPRSPADLAEERSLPKDDPSITRNKAR